MLTRPQPIRASMTTWILSLLVVIHALMPIGHHFLPHTHGHAHGTPAELCCDHDHAQERQADERGIERFTHSHCCDGEHEHHHAHHAHGEPCESTSDDAAPCSHECNDDCPWCAMALVKFVTLTNAPTLVDHALVETIAIVSERRIAQATTRHDPIRGPPAC